MRLVLCADCSRHVSSEAEACPFCGHASFVPTTRRLTLGRVARSALIAGTVSAAVACGGSTDVGQPDHDAGCQEDTWAPATLYGLSPPKDAGCK